LPPPLPTNSSAPDVATALGELQEYIKSLAQIVAHGLPGAPSLPQTAATTPSADATRLAVTTQHSQTKGISENAEPRPSAAPRSIYPAVLLESILPQAGCPWKGEILEVIGLAVADKDSVLPPDTSHAADVVPLHARDAEGQIVARSRRVQVGSATSSAPPSMLEVVEEGRRASNDHLLHEYLEKCGRASCSSIEWADSQGFTTTVGGARVPNDCAGTRAMLNLLGNCYDVASFSWFGLTGALHSLSGIERLCFHRVPAPGDEMLIFARMAHPLGGFWRADVAVFDSAGDLFAEISGMEGMPLPSSGTLDDPAERAWRRFAQRLGRSEGKHEDIAS
ncbi:MAG TPA: hypothetical protein VIV60_20460, partial [Polyangiaceae bacterium]